MSGNNKYVLPPTSLEENLKQLAEIKAADEESLSQFQKDFRTSVLSQPTLKRLRIERMREMVVSGCSEDQIRIAFVAIGSPLNVLVDNLFGDSGVRGFKVEIKTAFEWYDAMDAQGLRDVRVKEQQRLLTACLSAVPRVQPSQVKAMIELAERLQGNIEKLRKPDVPVTDADAAEVEEAIEEAIASEYGEEEEFVPDDSTEDSVSSEE